MSPSTVLGQEPPKRATSDDIVFADFESGTYDGWTLEGNCWTPVFDKFSDMWKGYGQGNVSENGLSPTCLKSADTGGELARAEPHR